jgi:hypothetical protein
MARCSWLPQWDIKGEALGWLVPEVISLLFFSFRSFVSRVERGTGSFPLSFSLVKTSRLVLFGGAIS